MKQVKQRMIIALKTQRFEIDLKVVSAILVLIFSLFVLSFTQKPCEKTGYSGPWVLDKVVSNVEFYHMLTGCNGKNVVLLKFNNKNDYRVKISWKEAFDTQLEKHTKGFAGQKQLVLAKGELVQGGCNTSNFKDGVIQPNQITPTYPAEVMGFEFVDIKVIRLQ